MKKVILAFLVMTFFLGGAGLSEGAPVKEFSVLSFSPSGQVKGRPPIRIAFSGNAVSREVVG
ncbi:MAG: hypothetical protein GX843_07800, partial [Synergistaceae bacterium]|nr:hypothetical protein [Synergistaceae bacterium]